MNKKIKNQKAITLIALVITIIILLILAGISIASLTGSGLFERAKEAKEVSNEAEVKEKISLLLSEYQIRKISDEKLTIIEFFMQKKNEKEVDEVTDNNDGTIDVELKGYIVKIDIEKESIIKIEKNNDIKISYEVKSFNNGKYQIEITVIDNEAGIQSIQISGENVQSYDGQKEVMINYEIDKDTDYVVTVENTTGEEKKQTINLKTPNKPTIKKESMYPKLTLTGVEIPKIEIEYDQSEDFDNYYSLDNGETWIPYTGAIERSAITTNIKAKSYSKKWEDLYIISDELTIEQAIGMNAFDNDLETFEDLGYRTGGKYYVGIDSSCIGYGIYLSMTETIVNQFGIESYVSFVNENFDIIQEIVHLDGNNLRFVDAGIKIPSLTKYIEIKVPSDCSGVYVEELRVTKINNILPVDDGSGLNDFVKFTVSDFFTGNESWMATDGDLSTSWNTNSGNYEPHWFQIELNTPRVLTAYFLRGAQTNGEGDAILYEFYMEASDDGVNWIKLEDGLIHKANPTTESRTQQSSGYYVEFENKNLYKYYRIYFPKGGWTWGSSGGVTIQELKLFDDALTQENNVTSYYKLTDNMTSNTSSIGKAFFKDGEDGSHPAYCAFDGNEESTAESGVVNKTEDYVQYDFNEYVSVKKLQIIFQQSAHVFSNCKVTASADGTNWDTIIETDDFDNSRLKYLLDVKDEYKNKQYKNIRIWQIGTRLGGGDNRMCIAEIQMYNTK